MAPTAKKDTDPMLDAEATQATPLLPLPVPSQAITELPLPEFVIACEEHVERALTFHLTSAGGGGFEEVENLQAMAIGHAAMVRQLRNSEERARQAEILVCAFARAIGAAVGRPSRGRPPADEDRVLPEITGRERSTYSLCAEPTPSEFRDWCKTASTVSVDALSKLGAKLRASRDRDTGEPVQAETPPPPGSPPPPKASDRDTKPENLQCEEPDEADETPAPQPHRLRVWQGLATRMTTDLADWIGEAELAAEELPEETRPQVAECVRSAAAFRDQLASVLF